MRDVPDEAVALVGQRVTALGRIGTVEGAELLLDVIIGLGLEIVAIFRKPKKNV
ncbi:MAG: hypothetical protein NVS3B8_03810 [Chitinophagaceae bacterium]